MNARFWTRPRLNANPRSVDFSHDPWLLRGFTPERSTVLPDGVIQTELAFGGNYALHLLILAISIALLVKLLAPAVRGEFSHRSEA